MAPGDVSKVSRLLAGRKVEAGEFISEDPCLPRHYLAQFKLKGRPCPRVVLDPLNGEAASLSGLFLQSHLKPLVPVYAAAILPTMNQSEQISFVRRIGRALSSPAVIEKLYPRSGSIEDAIDG